MSCADELIDCYCSPKHVHSHCGFEKEWISLVDVQLPVPGISSSSDLKLGTEDWKLSSHSDCPCQLLVRVGLARWEDVDEDGEFVLTVKLVDPNGDDLDSMSSCISDHGTLQDYFVFDLARHVNLMAVDFKGCSLKFLVHRVHAHMRKKSIAGRFFHAAKSSIKRALLVTDATNKMAHASPILLGLSLSQLVFDAKRKRVQNQGTLRAQDANLWSFSMALHVVSSDNSAVQLLDPQENFDGKSHRNTAITMDATIYDGSNWRFCLGSLDHRSLIFTEALTNSPVADLSVLKIVRVEYFDNDQSPMAVHQLVRITMEDGNTCMFYADCGLQWADAIHRAVWNQPFCM